MESPSSVSKAFEPELEDVNPSNPPIEQDADAKEIALVPIEDGTAERVKRDKKRPLAANLPHEVIEQILYVAEPETFAALVLINSAWRSASLKPDLYAYHLSRCPSFSASNNVISGPFRDESLPELQKLFAQEVKRNLFEVYLRPRQTIISLISTTTSSSAAFPGGEAFDFTFSPKGRWCLALSSSRIFVIDVASPTVSVRRELKVLRRPLSAAILDDGSRLAVLSTDHKVNTYDLSGVRPKFLRSLSLDNPPHTITLSAKGEVLAAAYDGGVEVHSLAANAVATDQRSVKCNRVDHLAFSGDGTMLLGTTQTSKSPATVILSAPYFTDADHDMPHHELISHMWTSQILFPNSSRDCSHATLLPHQRDGDASWTLTYDSVFESFRAVRTDDLRNGTTYFTGPKPKSKQRRRSKSRLVPCTLPTITEKGELVASGFLGNEVWMYGVPEGLDTPGNPNPTMDDMSQGPSNAGPSTSTSDTSPIIDLGPAGPELERLPRWQVLVDKYRNVFAKGRRVAKVPGVAGMSWVCHEHEEEEPRSICERLIVAAPGGVSGSLELEPGEVPSVDGGRLVVLDFDRAAQDGRCEEMTIEVGDREPELLEEENVDMATEVAIVRRRTVAQRQSMMARVSVAEALARPSAGGLDVPAVPPLPESSGPGFGHVAPPTETAPVAQKDASPPGSPTEGPSLEEVVNALDDPYSHTNPRSRNTLYRSATAVAANRMRNTARIPDTGRVEYRRTDGTELPHESDADNWVPPPPPYTPDADAPLPHHLRIALASGAAVAQPPVPPVPRFPQRSQTTRESSFVPDSGRRRSSADIDVPPVPSIPSRLPAQRQSSNPVVVSPQSNRGITSPIGSTVLSDVSSLEQRSPPAPLSPAPSRRRPMSAYDHRPSNLRGRMDNRSTGPMPSVANPTPIHRRFVSQPVSLRSSPTNQPPAPSNITLSGSNLQQRLDYPLPPPPPELSVGDSIDRRPSPLDPVAIAHPSVPPSPSSPVHPPVPSLPSAYQLNNLQNRYNTAPIPASRPMVPYLPYTQSFPMPGPPRGAMGALGRAPSISRSGAPIWAPMEAPARALSRNNSRGSSREGVASAPNLLRPQTRRLDTIYSIASRGDDRANLEREIARPSNPFRTMSESRLGGRMGRRENRWMGRKGREMRDGMRGVRRAETPGPEDLYRERDLGEDFYGERREKRKGTKCIVM